MGSNHVAEAIVGGVSDARRFDRRTLVLRGAALGAGLAGAGTVVRFGLAAQEGATPEIASPAAGDATPGIVAAANAFLETLSDEEREAVLFDFTDTEQKQRWSNLPEGLFERDGLMWGNLAQEPQDAWLALMQATMSTEGYNRVLAQWAADDALTSSEGGGGGGTPGADGGAPGGMGDGTPPGGFGDGGPPDGGTPGAGGFPGGPDGGTPGAAGGGGGMSLSYGMQYYWVAIIGEPSETDPWQWQWGGHHVQVNATVVGPNVALTPSFIGVQPATYTNENGETVRPLGDIEDEAFALVASLDETQQAAAVLGDDYMDLVLGPGQDGRTVQPEGLAGADMTAEQQAAFLHLIGHYGGLVNEEDAAGLMAEIEATLGETYLAWYGSTSQGEAAYFRVTGPEVVIEYSPQSMGGNAADHIHGVYRHPTNDYGAEYTGITISS